jgi:hypothetical protein
VRLRRGKVIVLSALAPIYAHASVVVEQLEALETPNTHAYAPIDFNGSPVVTVTTGVFSGITFHAIDPTDVNLTDSSHASSVGQNLYASGVPGNPYVTDVYCGEADPFFGTVLLPQNTVSTSGPIPGHFVTGAQIINNSYVGGLNSDLDGLRRFDFMIQRDDVTFVAAAAINSTNLSGAYQDWTAYDALSVRSDNTDFIPGTSPGKSHPDVWAPGEASFATGAVSGYVAGLYGHAQAVGQTDAQHDVVMRSLIMSGADKSEWSRDTANNLSALFGAGNADYNNSLASLQGGQQSIQALSGGSVTGTLATGLKGWAYGNVPAGGQSVLMFHTSSSITGITASLNWDVTSKSTTNTIDTTNTGSLFADINLEIRPVTFSGGHYALGPSLNDTTLVSNASNDNVQYIYTTSTLAPGNYAFVMTGDAALSPAVGLSYIMQSAATVNQWAQSTGGTWNNSANWSNGIPNAPGAQANLLTSPTGLTSSGSITLDGARVVGEMTFNNANSYSIDPGAGGSLTINDVGDPGGVYPSINVVLGNHSITAPVSLAAGLNVSTTAGNGLNITNNLTGVGGLITGGKGTLTLGGIDNYGDTNVSGGTLTVNGSIASTNVTVASGATLLANGSLSTSMALSANGSVTFGANAGNTVVARTLGSINIGAGGLVTLASTPNVSRTVLVTGGLVLANSGAIWTGKLDLNSNDMIVKNGSVGNIFSQLKSGRTGGHWNGAGGIVSTTAGADTKFLTTLGFIPNNDGLGNRIYGNGAPYGLFDGQDPSLTDVLVKYTYYGDADLNGVIDGRDYAKIDIGFASHLTGWLNGDFNYDGVVNGVDYSLIDNAFNQQTISLSALASSLSVGGAAVIALSSSASVPEPGSLTGLVIAAGLLSRRRARTLRRGDVV